MSLSFDLFFDDSLSCDELEVLETERRSFHHSTLADEFPLVTKEEVFAKNAANKKTWDLEKNLDGKKWYSKGKRAQNQIYNHINKIINKEAEPVSIGKFLSVNVVNNVEILEVEDLSPEESIDNIACLENVFNFESSILSSFFDKEGFFFHDGDLYSNYPVTSNIEPDIIKNNVALNEKTSDHIPSVLKAVINLISNDDYQKSKTILNSWLEKNLEFKITNVENEGFYNEIMNSKTYDKDLNCIFLKTLKNYGKKHHLLGKSIYGYKVHELDSFLKFNFKDLYSKYRKLVDQEKFFLNNSFHEKFFSYVISNYHDSFQNIIFLCCNHGLLPSHYRKTNGLLYLPLNLVYSYQDFNDLINSFSMTWGLKMFTRNDSLVETIFHYLNAKKYKRRMRFHRDSLLIN